MNLGKLTTVTGPMFSGKTTELIRLYDREMVAGRNSLVFKPSIDTRYSKDSIANHKGDKRKANICDTTADVFKIITQTKEKVRNIFIDEIQFFEGSIIDIIGICLRRKINVICASLNMNHKNEPFPFKDKDRDMGYLLAISDTIISLTGICNVCGEEATKTFRKQENTKDIVVGGADLYEARCTRHYG